MFFKKKNTIKSPVDGMVIPNNQVADATFSESLMGPTMIVMPKSDEVCAPVSGTITMISETLHAFGMEDEKGCEILVHIGIDTVKLKGDGFKSLVKAGDTVKQGTPIIQFDRDFVKSNDLDPSVMVIVLNSDDYPIELGSTNRKVTTKDDIAIHLKK